MEEKVRIKPYREKKVEKGKIEYKICMALTGLSMFSYLILRTLRWRTVSNFMLYAL